MFAVSWSPGTKQLRQFAWACLPGFALIGFLAHRLGASWTAALIVAAVGPLLCLLGLARPTLLRVPYLLLMLFAAPIGWVVTSIGLVVVFCLVLVPLALVFRLMGRDALGLRSSPGWQPPAPHGRPPDYYRMG